MTPLSTLIAILIISSLTLILVPTRILTTLIVLEFLSLITILIVTLNLIPFSQTEVESLLIIFTISVCEASIGLGILVALIHSSGSDNTTSLTNLNT